MELLRRVASFGTSVEDLKNIYFLFVRSQLEQSAVVWHSSLTEDNKHDLERVQKSAVKIILGEKYKSYQQALSDTLDMRRENLCIRFAKKCVRNYKTAQMFPLKEKKHAMQTRKTEKFEVQNVNTDRLRDFALIYMQNLLNKQKVQS